MSALYYVLGVVAKMNSSMWRFRINLLPINVLAIGALIFAGFGTLTDALEGMHNASSPIAVSVAQIHNNPSVAQNYVTVAGLDIPEAVFEYGDKGSDGRITTVQRSWSPLFDRESRLILL